MSGALIKRYTMANSTVVDLEKYISQVETGDRTRPRNVSLVCILLKPLLPNQGDLIDLRMRENGKAVSKKTQLQTRKLFPRLYLAIASDGTSFILSLTSTSTFTRLCSKKYSGVCPLTPGTPVVLWPVRTEALQWTNQTLPIVEFWENDELIPISFSPLHFETTSRSPWFTTTGESISSTPLIDSIPRLGGMRGYLYSGVRVLDYQEGKTAEVNNPILDYIFLNLVRRL